MESKPVFPRVLEENEASSRFTLIISHVAMPDLPNDVGTTSLNIFQGYLLNGHGETPGLLDAQSAISEGDVLRSCQLVGAILRDSLLNKVMSFDGRDARRLTEGEIQRHDPGGFFTGNPETQIVVMGSTVAVDPMGIGGPVVSALWKKDALGLMDIMYGLGEECLRAAKLAGSARD